MGTTPDTDASEKSSTEFKLFAAKRIILGAVGVVVLLWLVSFVLNLFDRPETERVVHTPPAADVRAGGEPAAHDAADEGATHDTADERAAHTPAEAHDAAAPAAETNADAGAEAESHAAPPAHDAPPVKAPIVDHGTEAATAHGEAGHGVAVSDTLGVTFVNAMIAPIRHELEERFFGWRPNDIIEWTDNVNNYQLGVLEVTRRTAEVLADRISRTGSTQAFEKELEKARSNFNINADQYWLPSAEASYREAVELLENYKRKLENGTAYFYNRTDNLIPLLRAYANLLGSCDDNLIKTHEDDGGKVSWYQADNYFYYAKGVAAAMHSVLQAVAVDFANTIETRRGTEVLHHAIEALHHATAIEPFIIFDSAPDGLLANHRANMAAPISHARFYVELLVETLST